MRKTMAEWNRIDLKSGNARRKPAKGWHLCGDGLYRKDKPRCKDEKHKWDGSGCCKNCDTCLRPHEETATGR